MNHTLGKAKLGWHIRVPIIFAAIVLGLWYMNWRAEAVDFQFANFGAGILILLGVSYAAFELRGPLGSRPWLLAVIPVLGCLGGLVFFKFDGFSGEMLPLFSSRFGSAPELREFSATDSSSDEAELSTTNSSDPLLAEQGDDSFQAETPQQQPPILLAPASNQFLGNNRDGVIKEREFRIPTSADDVEVLWDQGIGSGWSSFAVSQGLAITLEQRGEKECVTAYKLESGEPVWIHRHGSLHANLLGGEGPRSTPLIREGKVYALGASGTLWCLDFEQGSLLWQADLLKLAGWSQSESEDAVTWGRSASPLWVDGACIVPFGGPGPSDSNTEGRSLIAFDGETGDVLWRAGTDQISYASPMLMTFEGQPQIVSVNEATITGHDPGTGKMLWSFPWEGQSNGGANCAAAIPAGENQFVIGKGYGGGSALIKVSGTKTKGQEANWTAESIWESSRLLKTKFNHANIQGAVAYSLSNGILEAVDLEQERSLWRQPRRGRFGQGQVIRVEDVLVVQSEEGDVAFVDAAPDQFRELCRLPALDHKTWNIPTVAGRFLLVRNDRRVITYRLPKRVQDTTLGPFDQ